MLPYYLKNLEILVQHYTVPVALGKSIEEAPNIFKEGLKTLIEKINAGDSTINPYMEFAKEYPVRDSMRMMRLLFRLSLGSNERKQEQLLTFSRNISSLQQKAREARYKERLEKWKQNNGYACYNWCRSYGSFGNINFNDVYSYIKRLKISLFKF